MKKIKLSLKKYAFFICILSLTNSLYSQTQDYKVQHIQNDVANSGSTNTSFTPVSSLNSAFALANNNRKTQAGFSSSGSNAEGDDLAGARRLTSTNTLSYYRESGSNGSNTRFNSSIWEYIGPSGGDNEMIIRGRYVVTLNGTTNSVTQALVGISNANKCIPFITGIMNNTTQDDADSGTAIAYLENSSTLRVQKGSNGNNVTVYITLVEFTGSNWTVLHGDSGNVSGDTGSITLKNGSNGTGTSTNVSSWSDAVIFSHHRGDTNASGINDAIADNWPVMDPGSNNQTVDWVFDANHDSSGTNRQFVHVLVNTDLNVTRFQNTSNSAGQTTLNISSAGLTNINQALIVGSSRSSGSGTAYARGWRNYYINSTTQAAHWSHRSGNTMTHEIQIIDLAGLVTTVSGPEMNVVGSGTNIIDGDTTPTTTDDTDFGSINVTGGTNANTFTIQNTGSLALNLTGGSPYVTISGANASDFTLTANPTSPIAASGSTTFTITFDPSNNGLRTATITIANDDSNENPYSFNIQGTGFTTGASGNTVVHTADFETSLEGWTSGGVDASRVNYGSRSYLNNYSLQLRDDSGVASSFDSPSFDFSQYDKVDFKFFFTAYNVENTENFFIEYSSDNGATWITVSDYLCGDVTSKNADYESTNSIIFYSKTSTLLKENYSFPAATTSKFRVRSDSSDDTDLIYIDNIKITGTTYAIPTDGPGGISKDLDLWLRADQLDGTTVGTDGANVSEWKDNGKGNDAETVVSGQEPVYRNNAAKNFNFNPVIDFENNNNTANRDMTYIINDGSRDELRSTSGFNSNDMFVVIMPDPTITTSMIPLDTFTSTDPTGNTQNEDVTGFGYGGYTARFDDELFTYCIGTTSGLDNGYGRTSKDVSVDYNQISIINTRHNAANTGIDLYLNNNQIGSDTSDAADYAAVNNTRYWLGRSQYWNGSFDGRIAEVITYSQTKDNTNLNVERNRIQSYLALKYGITLGVNGTAQDYVDSDGTPIWDQSANSGYNYDIAGIGRDDSSRLNQKQSSSVNKGSDGTGPTEGILTIGLSDIYTTNNLNVTNNATSLNNKEFLTWGNNGANLDNAASTVSVNMSANITPALTTNVTFTAMQRVWKVVENGGDIPKVKVSIPQNAIRNITPPGSYLMFISDTPVFDPTADYRVLTQVGGNLETTYDFDNTKYITFGYAPQVVVERSVYFDGAADYVDMEDALDLNTAEFTISAWVNRASGSTNASIVSKRNVGYTEGYDFKINSSGHLEASWNGGSQTITSSVVIPENKWHHLAVIYGSGTATLYIDGVADTSEDKLVPIATSQSFFIAAAGKNAPTAHFKGSIDEVRVWNIALSQDQLRYIMNQEIEDNSNFVNGKILPAGITKNEVSSIPWNELAGYYPMSVYTYTNTNDESGNNNQGALRNLKTVDRQTAPLPYNSSTGGDWDQSSTWINGTLQNIPGTVSIVDANRTIDWNIVKTNHNITLDNSSLPAGNSGNRSVLFLDVEANKLTVSGDNSTDTGFGLTVSHLLSIDGKIDLQGESQLIQSKDSDFDVTSEGTLERDQQGTEDLFTYNYWSSPVGVSNTTTNNNSYTMPDILFDGTDPSNPNAINFITNSYNGTSGDPIGIADYWIWKYSNLSDSYYNWQHVRSTGSLLTGEGFTMKGTIDTNNNLTQEQNYVFVGKPNNGSIALPITANNEYLVGNPYASAIDANQFITDNGPTITGAGADSSISGTLYFWEHWGGGSHNTAQYQGGYATYNFSGSTPAPALGTNTLGSGGAPTKLPGRYIPVSQGFFVTGENTGTIKFNNGQRVFKKEDANSTFIRLTDTNPAPVNENGFNDNRMKIRIGFNSPTDLQRQLLVTVDQKATQSIDYGYDGENNEPESNDMFWMIENRKFVIQGVKTIHEETVLPLGIQTTIDGLTTITIDALENVPDNLNIYLHDIETENYYDLRQEQYQKHLPAGNYLTRFEITFQNGSSLGINDIDNESGIQSYFANDKNAIIVNNPELNTIKTVALYNMLGQLIVMFDDIETQDYTTFKTDNLTTGNYILEIKTEKGKLSKKVLVD